MSSPDEESLRKMSYSELRKHAKTLGIRKSLKAEKIIASILSLKEAEDEDSFVTLERQIINSSKKNKELLFEEDKKVISDTPRRDTYTVEDPLNDKGILTPSIVATSASPELKSNACNILNKKTESAVKNRQSKRKVSFVTPLRRSARFFTATPQYNSLKGRPKTPIPNRLSSSQRRSLRGNKETVDSLCLDSSVEDGKTSAGTVKRPSTPMPISKQKRKRISSLGHSDDNQSPNLKPVSEIAPVLKELTEETSDESPSHSDDAQSPKLKPVLQNLTEETSDETPKSFYATPSASSDVKQDKVTFSEVNENSTSATPLPKSAMKLKPAQKTKATPKTVTPRKVGISTPGLIKKTPLPSKKDLVSMTPGFKPIKTPSATPGLKPLKTPLSKSKITTSGLKPLKTPMSKSKITITGSAVKFETFSSAAQKASTPIPGLKLTSTPALSSSNMKKIATPNFQKIHQEAFDKMENIADYQKRKALNSAKKLKEQRQYHAPAKSNIKKIAAEKVEKIPKTFGGIPFVPSTKKAGKMNVQKSSVLKPTEIKSVPSVQKVSGMKQKKTITTKSVKPSTLSKKLIKAGNARAIKSTAKENTPLKQRPKFDLRASLARKLSYKPHTGPLKPLTEGKQNGNISTTASLKTSYLLPPAKNLQTENQVVNNSRMETRDVLRGVRKNKRFLLQMNNRNLSMQQ